MNTILLQLAQRCRVLPTLTHDHRWRPYASLPARLSNVPVAVAFFIMLLAFADRTRADGTVFDGKLTTAESAELTQWFSHYFNRVDNGTTIGSQDFLFSNPLMNSPLFMPVRGVRRTLEQVGLLPTDSCDGLTDLTPGAGDPAVAAALRAAMMQRLISTHSIENTAGTSAHLNLIAAAPGTGWTVNGDVVVSTNLPWSPDTTAPQTPTAGTSLSEQTQAAIQKLIDVGPIIAATSAGVTETQKLLSGELSHADYFEQGVRSLLLSGDWIGKTWRIDAVFSVFGSLPLVGVTFADCFVLLDSVNGALQGPFAPDSPLSIGSLFSGHPDLASPPLHVRFFKIVGGCPADHAVWLPLVPSILPRNPTFGPPVNVVPPWSPTPITLDPSVPGWYSAPACTMVGTACVCTEYGQGVQAPPGRIRWIARDRVCPSGTGCPPPGFPAGCFTPTVWFWW